MQTIGERLEDARKKKGVSIREAAEATKIRGDYLLKFEGNQFDIGLTEIYVRGFLRGYANFLRLPSERILNDYAALGRSEVRPRQPSREVYGRMDLSVSAADGGPEAASPGSDAAVAAVAAPRSRGHLSQPGSSLPRERALDPAQVLAAGKWTAAALVAVLILWGGLKLVRSDGSSHPAHTPPTATEQVESAPLLTTGTLTLTALETVRIKVVRQSDGTELYQGSLDRGERREYPNVPIFLTATALQSVRIEVKGKTYAINKTGWDRVPLDFSAQK